MKKIIVTKRDNRTIDLDDVSERCPIFAEQQGKLVGMMVLEDEKGWILRLGGKRGAYGYRKNLRSCLEEGLQYGYEFFVE